MELSLEKILNNEQFSLSFLKVLLENSYDSIIITDCTEDTSIIYVNKAFNRLTGYESSEVIGKTPKILQGSDTDRHVIANLTDSLKNDSPFEGQAINYRKDGTPFIMNWRVLPLKIDNQTKAWIAIQREIDSSYGVVA
ncbi:MAG: PAS domain S-box protein [Gammaproteobacteria bacterium]|nr:PAS domain S-box protein [Gammaproteobacteria bacterium]